MHIAILTWWISTEREVALRSGANMRDWCITAWHTVDVYDIPESIDMFLSQYKEYNLVIPMLHGRYGEDGIITGMCETLWIRIAWSSSSVHALCMDKFHTNCVVEKIWIKVPKSWIPWLPIPPKLLPAEWVTELDVTLIVKPNQWWSSLATSKAKTPQELKEGMENIDIIIKSLTGERLNLLSGKDSGSFIRQFPPLTDVPLVQECIEWREFTVGVYRDQDQCRALPVMEIVTRDNVLFDYREKYETDGYNEIFVTGDEELQKRLQEESTRVCEYIGIKWVVRLDWRYDGKDIYFLEVNTIPGFTSGSFVPKMWKKAGKTEGEFINMLSL